MLGKSSSSQRRHRHRTLRSPITLAVLSPPPLTLSMPPPFNTVLCDNLDRPALVFVMEQAESVERRNGAATKQYRDEQRNNEIANLQDPWKVYDNDTVRGDHQLHEFSVRTAYCRPLLLSPMTTGTKRWGWQWCGRRVGKPVRVKEAPHHPSQTTSASPFPSLLSPWYSTTF